MLTFFTPLLKGAEYLIVYYTNKTPLSDEPVKLLKSRAPLILYQQRPELDSLLPQIIAEHKEHKASVGRSTGRKAARPGPVRKLTRSLTTYSCSSLHGSLSSLNPAVPRLSSMSRVRRARMTELAAWCALYCGGSTKIRDQLRDSARALRIGWEDELFDW